MSIEKRENPGNLDDSARAVRYELRKWKGLLSRVDESYVRSKIVSEREGSLGVRVAKVVIDEGAEFFQSMSRRPTQEGPLGFRDYLVQEVHISVVAAFYMLAPQALYFADTRDVYISQVVKDNKEIEEEDEKEDSKQILTKMVKQSLKMYLGTDDSGELKLKATDPKMFIAEFTAGQLAYRQQNAPSWIENVGKFLFRPSLPKIAEGERHGSGWEFMVDAVNAAKDRFNLLYDTAQRLEEAGK